MTGLRFDGLVALVTGVSPGGLGAAYASLLAERGAFVVVNDLGVDWAGASVPPGAAAVVEQITGSGGKAVAVLGDVSTESERIVADAVAARGRLDVLVNNAGAGGDFDTSLAVHLGGAHRMSEAAWPWLVESGAGRIVNVASPASWGMVGPPGYAAAKAGVLGLTRVQARAGRDIGIGVNAVLPSAWANSTAGAPDAALRDFLRTRFAAEHVAGFVAYLAHRSATISGMAFAVGGGVVARVVQTRTRGVVDHAADPDVWAARIDEITDVSDELIEPPSMWGDVAIHARQLGPDALREFAALGVAQDLATSDFDETVRSAVLEHGRPAG